MRRFWCEKENISGGKVHFTKEEAAHIKKVLRMQAGDKMIVSSGDGVDLLCRLLDSPDCVAEIEETKINENEPRCELALFQGIIKNEKMDYAVQKAAEIGVTRIVPVICGRTVVKTENAKDRKNKQERWQRIAREACKQCGRSKVPQVDEPVEFQKAAEIFSHFETKLVAFEEEKTKSISSAVAKSGSVAYFIGPEGGMESEEHACLVNNGGVSVSLGKRILRAETAAVVCGAVILAFLGEMDI